jgi:sulfur carrier protein
MELLINGESRQFPSPLTVAELVVALNHAGKRIAVERNGEIVPRGRHAKRCWPMVTGSRSSLPSVAAEPH